MTVLNEESPAEGEVFRTVKKVPKGHGRAIIAVSYVRDPLSQRDYLLTCAHDSMKVWQVDGSDPTSLTEKLEIKGWRSGVQDFDASRDGTMAVVVGVDSLIHQIDLSLADLTHSTNIFNIGFMEQWFIRISPDKTRFLTVSFSGFLTQLNVKGSVEDSYSFNAVRQTSSLSFSPDGKLVAVANNEGVVTILDAPKLATRFFFEAHAIKVRTTCFSPTSDRLLTGSDDKIVKLYTIGADKAQLVKSFCGHRSCITAVRFHPRETQTFASSSNDGSFILWNAAHDRPLHIFQGTHDGVVKSISFSMDGFYIASVGEDRAICIHRIGNQESTMEIVDENQTTSQGYENSDANLQQGYNATIASRNYATNFNGFEIKKDDEEDELLARARRDLEGISDEEGSPV